MKLRRFLAASLSLALLCSCLAACGSGTVENETAAAETTTVVPAETESAAPQAESESSAPAEETAPAQTQAAPEQTQEPEPEEDAVSYPLYDEPVSFTWLDIRNSDYEQGIVTEGLAENMVYQTVADLLGIQIEWDLRTDASTVYPLIIVGGDYPDCWGSKLGDVYASYDTALEEDLIIRLDDYMDAYLPNYEQALVEYDLYDAAQNENGFLSVLPINTGYTQFGGQVRGDILEELGLDMPETFDDFHEMLLAMKTAYPDSQPLILSKDGSQNCSWLGGGLGVMTTISWRPFYSLNLYQIDGQVKLGLLEPEYKEYLEMLSQWYSEGLIYRDFFTNNGMGPPQDAISSDTSFVWYGSVNEIPTLNSILKDDGAYITGMADVTRTPGETIHLGDNTARYVSLSQGYAVSTDCEHPEYVLQFFDYLYTDEGYMLANYGVEGETYTMENGTPTYTDMILNNDTYTYVSALFKYCLYEGPFALDVGRYYAAFSADQVAAVQTWESNRDEDWNLSTNVTLTTEESERSATLTQELGTYCSEMILKFIVGDLDVDENWDTFQEMLITLGAEEIVSINQTALDRYNAQ